MSSLLNLNQNCVDRSQVEDTAVCGIKTGQSFDYRCHTSEPCNQFDGKKVL